MKRPSLKKIFLVFVVGTIISVASMQLVNSHILNVSRPLIFANMDSVPHKQAALILGAKVFADGRLSDIVADRTKTAIALYEAQKIDTILVSGDHGLKQYDEVNAIKEYLLNEGIPAADIFLDHAGFDTYDTLYRAKEIFKVTSLTIVTQGFHLPRALYIGNSLGLDVVGVAADKQRYLLESYNNRREYFARFKAFLDVVFHASPRFLGEAIPITGESKVSWD